MGNHTENKNQKGKIMKVKVISNNGNECATRCYDSVKSALKTEMSLLRWGINALAETDAYVGIFWEKGKLELFSSNGHIGGYTRESSFNEFYTGTPQLLWSVPVSVEKGEEDEQI